MRSIFNSVPSLTVLLGSLLCGGIAASAQTADTHSSETPSLQKDSPAVIAPAPEAQLPQLAPIAPPPSVVVDAAVAVPTEAQVVPPAPRLVKATSTGSVVLASRSGDGGYFTSAASTSTPLQINSGFGYRNGRMHTGIDYQASWGEPVGASMAGTVAFAGMKHGYGNLVIVDHGEGLSTYYAHLSSIYVGVGQQVVALQVLGAVGSTGRSTGPHLHYEVRVAGHPVNPTSTISFVNGSYVVNGQPIGEGESESTEPTTSAEPTSELVGPSELVTSRPRRVTQAPVQTTVEKQVLLYAKDAVVPR